MPQWWTHIYSVSEQRLQTLVYYCTHSNVHLILVNTNTCSPWALNKQQHYISTSVIKPEWYRYADNSFKSMITKKWKKSRVLLAWRTAAPSSMQWAVLLSSPSEAPSILLVHLSIIYLLFNGRGRLPQQQKESTTDLKINTLESVRGACTPIKLYSLSESSPTAHLIGRCASGLSPFAPDCTFPSSDPDPPSEHRSRSARAPEYCS